MEPLVAVLLILAALAMGLVLGWLVGGGRAGALAEERAKTAERRRLAVAFIRRHCLPSLVDEWRGVYADRRMALVSMRMACASALAPEDSPVNQ